MKLSRERISFLWESYITNRATLPEVEELFKHITENKNDEESAVMLRELLSNDPELETMDPALHENMLKKILPGKAARSIPFFQHNWFKYAAAIVIIAGLGTYLFTTSQRTHEKTVQSRVFTEIMPGSDKATLTLSDGQNIILDDSSISQITEGNAIINSNNGILSYVPVPASPTTPVTYNTMSTTRGGQYQLILPDGSKVWLNAMSSIKFPTAFSGKERHVEIKGEVYFEVNKNPAMPFTVSVNDIELKVLGTSFNVNAYADEKSIVTTLAEGSVKVISATASQVLLPSQQTEIARPGNEIKLLKDVNTSQVLAWKNGSFDFNQMPFDQVMRQLSRWYDIEVIYEKTIPSIKLWGTAGRDLTLSQVLEGLSQTGVHFRMEGNRVIVLP